MVYVCSTTAERNGSISAEHGLGVMKAPYIGYSQTPEAVETMKKLKAVFDPKGLLVSRAGGPMLVCRCLGIGDRRELTVVVVVFLHLVGRIPTSTSCS